MIKVTTNKRTHLLTHHYGDVWLDGAGHRWLMESETSTLKPLLNSECNAIKWATNYWNSWVAIHPQEEEVSLAQRIAAMNRKQVKDRPNRIHHSVGSSSTPT